MKLFHIRVIEKYSKHPPSATKLLSKSVFFQPNFSENKASPDPDMALPIYVPFTKANWNKIWKNEWKYDIYEKMTYECGVMRIECNIMN